MRRKNGFTLPEMIVVLLLIGILCGFAVPSLVDSWYQAQLDSAIQQFHRDVRWAQREAIKAQRDIQIYFYLDKQPYRYAIRYNGDPTNLRRRDFPTGISDAEAKRIFINRDKSFQKNGHIMIQKGGHQRYVYYYQTGRTRITKAPIAT